jgi:succinate dehydrogenase / fumarate reductase iron-sulfur subunit
MPEARFRIKRYDPENDSITGYYTTYTVLYDSSLTVLEGLFYIQEHLDGSLAFRYCCRAAVCGSCAMYIDGRYRLACQTNVRNLPPGTITVEPLPHLPLVKDLVCDMTDFFLKYEYIKPYLIRNSRTPDSLAGGREGPSPGAHAGAHTGGRAGTGNGAAAKTEAWSGGKEILQAPKDRHKLDMPIDCIMCGCCYSSCPSVWGEDNYLGPHALLKAYRFEVDSRDEARRERLPHFDNERGVYRCHTITNCVEACPKELNPTEAIQWLKGAAVRRRILGRWK